MIKMGIRVLFPLLLHTMISLLVAGCFADLENVTFVTVLTALVSLPIFWKMWNRDREKFLLPEKKQNISLWFYVAAFVGGIGASCVSSLVMKVIRIEVYFSNQVQQELLSAGIWLQVAGLGFIIPVLEELLYRGVVYQRLREFLSIKPAIVTGALLFGLAHGNMIQFLYAFPMALILQWLFEKSGTLTASVLFHIGANLISIIITAMGIT